MNCMAKGYVKHEYRKTPNIRPRLIESQAFFGGLMHRETSIRNHICVLSVSYLLLATQERGME